MQAHEDIFLLSLLFRNADEVFLKGKKALVLELIRTCKGLQALDSEIRREVRKVGTCKNRLAVPTSESLETKIERLD